MGFERSASPLDGQNKGNPSTNFRQAFPRAGAISSVRGAREHVIINGESHRQRQKFRRRPEGARIVKRHILRTAAALAALIVASSPLAAGTVRAVYRFDEPRVVSLANGFSRVEFDATVQAGKPGEPSYPFRGARILLPPGEAAVSIRLARSDWTTLPGAHRLHPAQRPERGIDVERAGSRFLYRAAAYAADRWVFPPESRFETQYLRGHAIATGTVSPVGYLPASDEVGYYRSIEVIVETAPAAPAREALDLLRSDDATIRRLVGLVDNPEALGDYASLAAPLRDPAGTFEYLVVTGAAYAAAFEPFRDFYTRRGMRTVIMTVEEIEAGYGGIDAAEKVRNCIKDKYISNGITHVLLAGDWDGSYGYPKVVPLRGLYGEVHSSETYVDAGLPSDLYFGALDGTWNLDGDERWGEPGEADLYSEIAVGRAPVDATAEITAFISKTVFYQELPRIDEARAALLLGEKLYNDPLTYGDDEVELLVGSKSDNGFTTAGIPASFDIVRKYDREAVWSKSEVFAAVNAGTAWIGHAGHSNSGYVMRMSRPDVTDAVFTNDGVSAGFPVVLSTGCYDGAFDGMTVGGYYETPDCIAEQMILINHCAAAFVCNSRYGWFTEGTTNGPSIHFMREFFDAVFTEGHTTIGEAHARSKDETAPFLDLPDEWEPGAHRWCYYESNLLGDPALDAWTDTPTPLTPTHAPAIGRSDTVFAVETGVPGAVACLWRDGEWYARATADALGMIALVRERAIPDSIAWLELDVTAHNRLVYRDTIAVLEATGGGSGLPTPSLAQNVPNPFNPSTVIRFALPEAGEVDLSVYDVSGRLVARLVHGRMQAGAHAVTWAPAGAASGIYFYLLRAQGVTIAKKAVLLR